MVDTIKDIALWVAAVAFFTAVMAFVATLRALPFILVIVALAWAVKWVLG